MLFFLDRVTRFNIFIFLALLYLYRKPNDLIYTCVRVCAAAFTYVMKYDFEEQIILKKFTEFFYHTTFPTNEITKAFLAAN